MVTGFLFQAFQFFLDLYLVRLGFEDGAVGVPGDQDELLSFFSPGVHRDVVLLAQVPALGRCVQGDAREPLDRAPAVADGESRQAGKPVAFDVALMAVDEEQHAEFVCAIHHTEAQALVRLYRLVSAVNRFEDTVDSVGILPLVVVVAPHAKVASGLVEFGFEFEGARISAEHRGRSFFPQFLDIAQHDQCMPHLEVIGHRGVVGAFGVAEIVRPIARAAM